MEQNRGVATFGVSKTLFTALWLKLKSLRARDQKCNVDNIVPGSFLLSLHAFLCYPRGGYLPHKEQRITHIFPISCYLSMQRLVCCNLNWVALVEPPNSMQIHKI